MRVVKVEMNSSMSLRSASNQRAVTFRVAMMDVARSGGDI
jgi:hypothetical protein